MHDAAARARELCAHARPVRPVQRREQGVALGSRQLARAARETAGMAAERFKSTSRRVVVAPTSGARHARASAARRRARRIPAAVRASVRAGPRKRAVAARHAMAAVLAGQDDRPLRVRHAAGAPRAGNRRARGRAPRARRARASRRRGAGSAARGSPASSSSSSAAPCSAHAAVGCDVALHELAPDLLRRSAPGRRARARAGSSASSTHARSPCAVRAREQLGERGGGERAQARLMRGSGIAQRAQHGAHGGRDREVGARALLCVEHADLDRARGRSARSRRARSPTRAAACPPGRAARGRRRCDPSSAS